MNDLYFLFLIIVGLQGWMVSGAIGAALGEFKGSGCFEGAVLGLMLGPLGWLIVAGRANKDSTCPYCLGPAVLGAKKCKSCGSEFGWEGEGE